MIAGKRNNPVLHFITYFGFFGGLATLLYPDFIDSQGFWEIRTLTGLIHHALMLYLSVMIIVTGYFKPDYKKWPNYIIGFMSVMTLGAFELEALNFPKAMYINDPLISSLPILTSWYMIFIVSSIAVLIFEFIYSKAANKNISKNRLKVLTHNV